jgi:hypothetical protein
LEPEGPGMMKTLRKECLKNIKVSKMEAWANLSQTGPGEKLGFCSMNKEVFGRL